MTLKTFLSAMFDVRISGVLLCNMIISLKGFNFVTGVKDLLRASKDTVFNYHSLNARCYPSIYQNVCFVKNVILIWYWH